MLLLLFYYKVLQQGYIVFISNSRVSNKSKSHKKKKSKHCLIIKQLTSLETWQLPDLSVLSERSCRSTLGTVWWHARWNLDHAPGRRLRNHHGVIQWGCKRALCLTGKRCLLTVPTQYILLTLLEQRRFHRQEKIDSGSMLLPLIILTIVDMIEKEVAEHTTLGETEPSRKNLQ